MNQITKKIVFIIIFGVLGITILATPSLAATTLLFAPANIDIAEGEDFTVRVVANSEGGVKSYTVKLELEYPADLLEIKSFTIADNWIQLNQPEYDLIDNTNGILIKTAGFPGGFSGLTVFGSVSFSDKKAGKGIIKTRKGSFVLDAENQNIFSGPLAQLLVTAAVPLEKQIPPVPEEEIVSPEKEIPPVLLVPEEEILPPPHRFFDILIEPAVKKFRKVPAIPTLVIGGTLLLIILIYFIYRRIKKKIERGKKK